MQLSNQLAATVVWGIVLMAAGRGAGADSVVHRLGAFDAARVEAVGRWIAAPDDRSALDEAAKLLYRLRRIDRQTLQQHAAGAGPWQPGDAVALRGTASGPAASDLPAERAEVLEMDRVYRVTLTVDGVDRYVITDTVPGPWLADPQGRWPAAVAGIVVRSDAQGRPLVIAASAVQWYPVDPARVPLAGWAVLGGVGFDVGLLDRVIDADRQPLGAGEYDAFYGMLAAAERAGGAATVRPQPITVAGLLSDSQDRVGQWLRIDLQTARLTRIAVNEPRARQILGDDQEYYWQIDAFADLGELQVRLEPTQADDQPVTFDNRFPVSLAITDLPPLLRQAVQAEAGRGAVLAMVRRQVTVEGFFYRLWSYDSAYVRSRGGGRPFGPLIIAARIQVAQTPPADPLGMAAIGWFAAAALLGLLAATVLWLWRVGRRDRQITRARRQRDAAGLDDLR